MIKKIIFFYLFATGIINGNSVVQNPAWVNFDQIIDISPFTNHIYRRYYFIARLSKVIKTISRLPINHLTLQLADHSPFKHEAMITVIQKIEDSKTIRPLLTLWEQFRTYKYIDDLAFVKEFTQLFLIIMRQHYHHLVSTNMLESFNPHQLSITNLFDVIDIYHEYILYKNPHLDSKAHHNHSLLYMHTMPAVSSFDPAKKIGARTIALRFYLLNRLQKEIKYLRRCGNKKIIFKEILAQQSVITLFKYKIPITHNDIHVCLNQLLQTNQLAPVLQLWDKFQQFQYIEDLSFMKDFLIMLVIVNIAHILNMFHYKSIPPSLYNSFYIWLNNIENHPIDHLLSLIDQSLEKIEIMEEKTQKKYHLEEST